MKFLTTTILSLLALQASVCAQTSESPNARLAVAPQYTLVGQLLLPDGVGNRGVEILIEVSGVGPHSDTQWILFDDQGNFSFLINGTMSNLQVTAGIGAEVYRIDNKDVPEPDQNGNIDVGVIDLRHQLRRHSMKFRTPDRKQPGVVRIGMWHGLPPVGPQGEPVSLGSRQFPSIALDSEIEWLLAHDAESIHFLVEWPHQMTRGTQWHSGEQQLFGPFSAQDIPTVLELD